MEKRKKKHSISCFFFLKKSIFLKKNFSFFGSIIIFKPIIFHYAFLDI